MAKIGLGTAQIGVPYGNKANEELMPFETAKNIIDEACRRVHFLDTAIGYGRSEERIGQIGVSSRFPDVFISSKIPPIDETVWQNESAYEAWVLDNAIKSLDRLKIERHRLLQFHQCDENFLTHKSVKNVFFKLLKSNIISEIGVSVYTLEQAYAAIATGAVSWLQVPVNIIDRRFLDETFLKVVRSRGIKLIARSVFLQGLMVPNADLPPVKRVEDLRELKKLSLEGCLNLSSPQTLDEVAIRFLFANNADNLDVILIGVDSVSSLRHNLAIIDRAKEPLMDMDLKCFEPTQNFAASRGLFNPAIWNK